MIPNVSIINYVTGRRLQEHDIFPMILELTIVAPKLYNLSKQFPNIKKIILAHNQNQFSFLNPRTMKFEKKFENLLILIIFNEIKQFNINFYLVMQQCPKLEEFGTNCHISINDIIVINYPLLSRLNIFIKPKNVLSLNFQNLLLLTPNLKTLRIISMNGSNIYDDSNSNQDYLVKNIQDIHKYGKNITSLALPTIKLNDIIVQTLIDMRTQLQFLKVNTVNCENVSEELKQKFYEKYYKM